MCKMTPESVPFDVGVGDVVGGLALLTGFAVDAAIEVVVVVMDVGIGIGIGIGIGVYEVDVDRGLDNVVVGNNGEFRTSSVGYDG